MEMAGPGFRLHAIIGSALTYYFLDGPGRSGDNAWHPATGGRGKECSYARQDPPCPHREEPRTDS